MPQTLYNGSETPLIEDVMNSFTIEPQISPDRRLIYTLPPEVPVGRVKLMIQAIEEQPLTREEARRCLLTAGKLVTALIAPPDALALSDEEPTHLAQLFARGPETTLHNPNLDHASKACSLALWTPRRPSI